ncbi:MAG TPA: rhomboid family intramembrane serine protease [Bacteroidales bacterium]|nr:rhomboid family intramembrane serine protease [Bacteroidales bacterium]
MNYPYSPQPNLLDEFRKFFRQRSALPVLLTINVVVWALIQIARVFSFFLNHAGNGALDTWLLQTLGLPAYLPSLMASPWTLFTYMFFHMDIGHILFNMIWLYWFGKIFLAFLSSRAMVWIYLLGGISGGLLYILAFNSFPVFSPMLENSWALGASASVMAIVTATAVYAPGYTIQLFLLGRLKIIYLAGILFVTDFFLIPSGNAGGHLAHIGGALFGAAWVFLAQYARSTGMAHKGTGMKEVLGRIFNRRKKTQDKTDGRPGRPLTDDEYNTRKRANQRRIDEILEKISRGGYDSLSKEEKDFLFTTSNKR